LEDKINEYSMVSVTEAKTIIKQHVTSLNSITLNLDEAMGYAINDDIISPINVPSFVQSSMDGYAFAFDDLKSTPSLTIIDTIQAGDASLNKIRKNQAVRIFTGAPLPEGADTVLMQEKAKVEEGQLFVLDEKLQKGTNSRSIGADIKEGAIVVKKGAILTPGAIGLLASLGITQVSVVRKPTINIILTGNELQDIGKPLSPGQIYESNSHTLKAGLNRFGIKEVNFIKVADNLESVTGAIKESLIKFDLTILTGGISVGDYDFVLEACQQNNVEQLFHKVKQKPGKPLYIGKKETKVVCALPGNPASVLSCFNHYVSVVLDQLSNTSLEMKTVQASLTNTYSKPIGLTHFLKGLYNNVTNEVTILEGQESFKLSAFAIANCFVELPEDLLEIRSNEIVKVHLF
jgi:molybdopterin molybdotransferase